MGFLGILYLLLLKATCRVRIEGEMPDEPCIIALWHGRLWGLAWLGPQLNNPCVPISLHKDGRRIATVAQFFGLKVISGSKKKRGAQAARELIRHGKSGGVITITPDAPPQKVYTCARGVADVSIHTRLPVVCVGLSSSKGKQFRSKDRFVLPWPFCEIVFYVATALEPPQKTQNAGEEFLEKIETVLVQTQTMADMSSCNPEWS